MASGGDGWTLRLRPMRRGAPARSANGWPCSPSTCVSGTSRASRGHPDSRRCWSEWTRSISPGLSVSSDTTARTLGRPRLSGPAASRPNCLRQHHCLTRARRPDRPSIRRRPRVRREAVLPVDVRSRLRAVSGAGADSMRVRLDAEADADARSHRADAVTVGTTVNMRSGRFRPDTAEGLALLAHEASHVTALLSRGGNANRNTPGGVHAEEGAAVRVERLARRLPAEGGALSVEYGDARLPVGYGDVPPVGDGATARIDGRHPSPRGGAPSEVPASTVPMAAVPMRADVDRAEATAAAVPFDADGLRHSIIEDLMRRLRTDSERGG